MANNLSRYTGTPIFIQDGVEQYHAWRSLPYDQTGLRMYAVTSADLARPDLIAHKFYGTSELWWAVLDFNRIADPFTLEAGDKLVLPPASNVKRLLRDRNRVSSLMSVEEVVAVPSRLSRPGLVLPYRPPAYVSPYAATEDETVEDDNPITYLETLHMAGPDETVSPVHFQWQLSPDINFPSWIARMSAVDQENWFYFDPLYDGGAGGFVNFDAVGLPAELINQQVIYKIPLVLYSEDIVSLGLDQITLNAQYYFRYRPIINHVEQAWSTPTPITFSS